jgi:hypothetical protein
MPIRLFLIFAYLDGFLREEFARKNGKSVACWVGKVEK